MKADLQPTVVLVPPRVDALLDPEDAGRLRRQSYLLENGMSTLRVELLR